MKTHNGHISWTGKNKELKNDKIEGVAFILKILLKTHMTYSKKLIFQFPIFEVFLHIIYVLCKGRQK